MELDSYPQRLCALLCSPFSAVKMGGPFSLRCLSPLCSPAVGAGQTQMAVLGMLQSILNIFATNKGQHGFKSTLAFVASRRACRPTAVFFIQLTGKPHRTGGKTTAKPHVAHMPRALWARGRVQGFSPARPASREACCRAAVTPQPTCFLSSTPHPKGAGWGQGALPLARAARPVAERRPWGRKRRKREAFRRAFPERHAYLYTPARHRRAEAGAGL